jgi:hypothetical protein
VKKTDIALVIFIAGISILIAYFVAKAVIGDPGEQTAEVKTAVAINDAMDAPSKEIFNKDAINPTVEVLIGENGEVEEDLDSDGVADSKDNCPNTPKNESVDKDGCSESQESREKQDKKDEP